MIESATKKLIAGEKLDTTTVKEVFDEIFSGLADDVELSAFITAFKVENIDIDEIVSAVNCANDSIKVENISDFTQNAINSITMADENNYLDISLASDIIAMANGLYPFKHSFLAPLKVNKSFEILNHLGIKIRDLEIKKDKIETTNLGYYYLDEQKPFLKYTKNLFRKISFDNLLYLIYKLLNPYKTQNIVIGLDDDKTEKIAELCLNLGYVNSLIISGYNKAPFISLEGESKIAEAWKNKIFAYEISAELLDIAPSEDKNLLTENTEHNAEILNNVFNNKLKDCNYDAIILNAGCVLYITKKSPSILDGINLAKKTIDDGLANQKLEQLKKTYN